MDGPYIVCDGYDCTAFRGKRDIIDRLETWDIVNNAYEVFDIHGYRLKFVFDDDELAKYIKENSGWCIDTTRRGVVIDLIRADREPQADEVKKRLRRYLEHCKCHSSGSGEDSLQRLMEQYVARCGIEGR